MLPPLFRLIGSDRFLSPEEVERADEPHSATALAWEIYETHFGGFTGAMLDPEFRRLTYPHTRLGRIRLSEQATVVVVGTDPSAESQLDDLIKLRDRVRVFTSQAGAEFLKPRRIVPDLVITGTHTVSVAGGPSFVTVPQVSWGIWQASAVALAAAAGASRIALVGVDAESAAERPLRALLELLARVVHFTAFDCAAGTPKRGWVGAAVGELRGPKLKGRVGVETWSAPAVAELRAQAAEELQELAPMLDRVRQLAVSIDRANRAADEIMAWRLDPRLRVLTQECLGASALPRLWRGRPESVLFALREVIAQAETLEARLRRQAA